MATSGTVADPAADSRGGGTRDVGLNIPMGSAPALAEFGGRLYCAFQEDGAHRLMVLSSSDGNTWTTFVPSDPGAGSAAVGVAGILIGSAPALAVFNGRLYCAFQANDPSHTLFVTSSSDGDHWQSPANGDPRHRDRRAHRALAALDGRLYCAYQADDGSRVLCVTTSTDGARWGPPTRYETMQASRRRDALRRRPEPVRRSQRHRGYVLLRQRGLRLRAAGRAMRRVRRPGAGAAGWPGIGMRKARERSRASCFYDFAFTSSGHTHASAIRETVGATMSSRAV